MIKIYEKKQNKTSNKKKKYLKNQKQSQNQTNIRPDLGKFHLLKMGFIRGTCARLIKVNTK